MKRSVKTLLIIAVVLILAGAGIFAWAMNSLNWDLGALSTVKYDIEDDFVNLSIDVNTAAVVFAPSEDGKCRVVFREYEDERHSAFVQGDTLRIELKEKGSGSIVAAFGFYPEAAFATVYLPGEAYRNVSVESDTGEVRIPAGFSFESVNIDTCTGDVTFDADVSGKLSVTTDTGGVGIMDTKPGELEIRTDTGRINTENMTCAGSVRVSSDTGDIRMTGMTCGSLEINDGTGDVKLENVIAEGRFTVLCTTGDIRLDSCDGSELRLESDTGDITGSLRSAKIFIVDSGSGDVDVPETSSGGRCEIRSKTGDLKMVISS